MLDKKNGAYLVLGGELVSLDKDEFRDAENVELVGVFADYEAAKMAWRARSQATVDNAHQRYYVLPLHEILKQAVE